MVFKYLSKTKSYISLFQRRNYFSNRINKLFVDNFDKYHKTIEFDENSDNYYVKTKLINILNEYSKLSESLKEVDKELNSENQTDDDLKKLMKEEKVELDMKHSELVTKVLNEIYIYEQLKSADTIENSSNIIFEVSPGVGGKEAMLFANELSTMYFNYFNYKNWDIKDVESNDRHHKARIEGRDVWYFMKYEAGVHRVQRIPDTERRGRVHTSTVSIACIPIRDDVRASGAGGQHVNTTDSAVRISHIPSGISVESQEDRSQIKNREIAMRKLKNILSERLITEAFEKSMKTRKSQVGQANRNEKIRTYNFKDDRVTDHRLSSLDIASIEKEDTLYDLQGLFNNPEKLEGFIVSLQKVDKERTLLDIFSELELKNK
ncbi:CLUMA_CG010322, isoform A [Clunio marinus]|uniref:CLUMA_CG010322, isoform A n=1 Tax=Clunio marinus TaxID=568069 RepID=A0A1J1I9K1_9DIPT|nr:CLUMA_CG010322, isoform A [Clunio marinus]